MRGSVWARILSIQNPISAFLGAPRYRLDTGSWLCLCFDRCTALPTSAVRPIVVVLRHVYVFGASPNVPFTGTRRLPVHAHYRCISLPVTGAVV
jgi:hypothetical protein